MVWVMVISEESSEDGDEDRNDDGGGDDEGVDGGSDDNDGSGDSSSETRILGFRARTVKVVRQALPRQAQPLGLGLTCFPGACNYHGFSLPLRLVRNQSCDSVISLQSVKADSKGAPCTSKGHGQKTAP